MLSGSFQFTMSNLSPPCERFELEWHRFLTATLTTTLTKCTSSLQQPQLKRKLSVPLFRSTTAVDTRSACEKITTEILTGPHGLPVEANQRMAQVGELFDSPMKKKFAYESLTHSAACRRRGREKDSGEKFQICGKQWPPSTATVLTTRTAIALQA